MKVFIIESLSRSGLGKNWKPYGDKCYISRFRANAEKQKLKSDLTNQSKKFKVAIYERREDGKDDNSNA